MQIIENTLEIHGCWKEPFLQRQKDEKGQFQFMRCITSLRKESIKYWGMGVLALNRGEDEDTDSKD